MRAASSILDEPLLTFLVWGNCSGTHTSLWSQPCITRLNGAGWLLAPSSFLQEHLKVWLRLSKPRRSLDLSVPRSSQSLWPVTPLPKLEFICGTPYISVWWLGGMRISAGSKHAKDTSACAVCHPQKILISPARLNSTHISQAHSGSHWSLLHFLWNNNLVLDHRLVCTFALKYRTCFDSATNKTKNLIGASGLEVGCSWVGSVFIYSHVMLL